MPGPPESKYYNSLGDLCWSCKYCSSEAMEKLFRLDNGTNQITTHLANVHRIQKDNSLSLKEIQRNQKIQDALKRAAESSAESKRRRIYTELDTEQLKQLVVMWLASCSVSFRMVENIYFRNLLIFLNSDIKEILPESHKTIRKWTDEAYEQLKGEVKQALQAAQSIIHLSVDLWTSPNHKALMGIVGHYITEDGGLQESVLALRELRGSHSAENQAEVIIEVVKDYGFASKLGYIMSDNATVNDKMMEEIAVRKLPLRFKASWTNIYTQGLQGMRRSI